MVHVTKKGNKQLFSMFTLVWYVNSPTVRKCILLQQLCPSVMTLLYSVLMNKPIF